METILRSEEMAEIKLLPVRHHSPACAIQIRKVIRTWKPTDVLIEGPENANALIPVMVHEDTKAPFAVYYACYDKGGRITKEKEHYKCYYPFMEYSPELMALREATALGSNVAFIDLSYGEILQACAEGKGLRKEEEKNSYNDDYLLARSAYIEQLCQRASVRHFDEFWEKYFEIEGYQQEESQWFQNLLLHCELSRKDTSLQELREEGCLAREAYMTAQVVKRVTQMSESEQAQEKRILVITGGFHTPAIREKLSDENWQETKKEAQSILKKKQEQFEQNVYLMPYSMEAADALNGYASGMPYAGFYQRVWEGMKEEKKPYEQAVLELLLLTGRELRKREEPISTYDEICAYQMTQGLATLRNKSQSGAYELLDAVLSSYVKGEYNLATDLPMRTIRQWMVGDGYGTLCAHADVPPIVHDFELQCKKFGLKNGSTVEQEIVLSIFTSQKHRQLSMFFHQMCFLQTYYARRIKGPDLQAKKDKNLIREIWKYKWSVKLQAGLIDVSVHGATITEAAGSLVREQLKQDIGVAQATILLTQVFEMGISEQLETVYERVEEQLFYASDFYAIAEAVKTLLMLDELGTLYQSFLCVSKLIQIGVRKLVLLLPAMVSVKDEQLQLCMDAVKLLYQITGRAQMDLVSEKQSFFDTLEQMKRDQKSHAGLRGCILGILYGCSNVDMQEIEQVCRGYLTGTREQMMQTAVFFRGLFYTAKDLVFIGDGMLHMIDSFLQQVEEEEFMELLPHLRMAFAYFTPGEIDRLAQTVVGLHGMQGEQLLSRREILPEWFGYGKELDEYARARIVESVETCLR